MKLLEISSLAIPEIKIIRFARFHDSRGYFTEHFRRSDFEKALPFFNEISFRQSNESFSQPGVIRGLHFQWNPYMGKLVRTISGHMVDLVLDLRKGSPTFGAIIAHDMPVTPDCEYSEWIWVPKGFAHGNFYLKQSMIEYFCSGEYNPECEAGISPLAADLDWSLCDPELKQRFADVVRQGALLSDKDKNAHSLASWLRTSDSDQFRWQAP
jgi:dTDP-4-dehydrorhamnose 3,5-epimerase